METALFQDYHRRGAKVSLFDPIPTTRDVQLESSQHLNILSVLFRFVFWKKRLLQSMQRFPHVRALPLQPQMTFMLWLTSATYSRRPLLSLLSLFPYIKETLPKTELLLILSLINCLPWKEKFHAIFTQWPQCGDPFHLWV